MNMCTSEMLFYIFMFANSVWWKMNFKCLHDYFSFLEFIYIFTYLLLRYSSSPNRLSFCNDYGFGLIFLNYPYYLIPYSETEIEPIIAADPLLKVSFCRTFQKEKDAIRISLWDSSSFRQVPICVIILFEEQPCEIKVYISNDIIE